MAQFLNRIRLPFLFTSALCLQIRPARAFDPLDIDLGSALSMAGKTIYDILRYDYALFGIIFILMVFLLRSVFMAGLMRVPAFSNSPFARPLSTAMSLLCTFGLVYMKLKSGRGVHGFLEGVLGPAGLYAAVALSVVLYVWFRHTIGKRFALPLAGMVAYSTGGLLDSGLLMGMGGLVFVVSLIFLAADFSRTGNFPRPEGSQSRQAWVSGAGKRPDRSRKRIKKDDRAIMKEEKDMLAVDSELEKVDREIQEIEERDEALESREAELVRDIENDLRLIELSESAVGKINGYTESLSRSSLGHPEYQRQLRSLYASRQAYEQRALQARLRLDSRIVQLESMLEKEERDSSQVVEKEDRLRKDDSLELEMQEAIEALEQDKVREGDSAASGDVVGEGVEENTTRKVIRQAETVEDQGISLHNLDKAIKRKARQLRETGDASERLSIVRNIILLFRRRHEISRDIKNELAFQHQALHSQKNNDALTLSSTKSEKRSI